MNSTILIFLIFLIAFIIYEVVIYQLKKDDLMRMQKLLLAGDFTEFDHFVEKKSVKFVVPPYDRLSLVFNSLLMRNDNKKVEMMMKQFDKMKLTEAQKQQIYIREFNYWLAAKDQKHCKEYLDKIDTIKNGMKLKHDCHLAYDICIAKKTEMLDQLLNETEKADEKYRSANEYLISEIYGTLNDKENQEKYRRLSKAHLTMLNESMV